MSLNLDFMGEHINFNLLHYFDLSENMKRFFVAQR